MNMIEASEFHHIATLHAGGPGSGRHAVVQYGKGEHKDRIRSVIKFHPDKKSAKNHANKLNGTLMDEEKKKFGYKAVSEDEAKDYE
jgi:hypothetical protein